MITMALGMSSMLALVAAAGPTTDGVGAYATGTYRNLFAEAGRTPQEIDARIDRAWKQLFEGDLETQRLYFPTGANENGPLAYIPALDGKVRRDRHSPGLVATNGLASLAATNEARARRFVEALWNLDVPSSHVFRYYDGLLYMMCLLHASGRFQVMPPPR